ncbi:bifunctional diguanylate cyclase/phosphohydrolase [Frankia tisae]|uniref:bifunctional diguanylate cyclase/phosphohydrolase n=1 Tax=Frankia tisae TaxID=2950104 RepID=UPI0027E254EB|nr:diguanylate cyclase [Frankia tisae]
MPAPPRRAWRGCGWVVCLGAALAAAVGSVLPPIAGVGLDVRMALYLLADLVAAVALLVVPRGLAPVPRRGWMLLAGSQVLSAATDVALSISLRTSSATVGVALTDIALLLRYPLLVLGLAALVRARGPGRNAASLLDIAMFLAAAALPAWVYLVAPAVRTGGAPGGGIVPAVCAAAGLLVVGVTVRIASGDGERPATLLLLAGGVLVSVVADAVEVCTRIGDAVASNVGIGGSGGTAIDGGDAARMVSALLLAAAVLHPSLARSGQSAVVPAVPVRDGLRVAALCGVGLVGPTVLGVQAGHGDLRDVRVIAMVSAGIMLLIIARMARLEAEQRHLAITDGLTGLRSRRYLEAEMRVVARRARRVGSRMGLLLVDVDHFKSVNDRFGHPAGDQVLTEVARRLLTVTRPGDVVARYGGEEFALLAKDVRGDALADIAERLRLGVGREPVEVTPPVSDAAASAGWSAAAADRSAPTVGAGAAAVGVPARPGGTEGVRPPVGTDPQGHGAGDRAGNAAPGSGDAGGGDAGGGDAGMPLGGVALRTTAATTRAPGRRGAAGRLRNTAGAGSVPVTVTVSVGGAVLPDDADDVRALVEVADRALYVAKETGRNRVAIGPEGTAPAGRAPAATPAPARPASPRPRPAGLSAVGRPAVGLPAVGLPAVGLPAFGLSALDSVPSRRLPMEGAAGDRSAAGGAAVDPLGLGPPMLLRAAVDPFGSVPPLRPSGPLGALGAPASGWGGWWAGDDGEQARSGPATSVDPDGTPASSTEPVAADVAASVVAAAVAAVLAAEPHALAGCLPDGIERLRRIAEQVDACHAPRADGRAVGRWLAEVLTVLGHAAVTRHRARLAGRLHNVGKILLPPHVLARPGPLDAEEWRLIRMHPLMGANLLAQVPGLQIEAEIIAQQREWFGGGGYPSGIAGSGIRIEARALAVCTAWAAMRGGRGGRDPLSGPAAREQLRVGRATQFDPVVVDVFLALESDRRVGLPHPGDRLVTTPAARAADRPVLDSPGRTPVSRL